MEFNTLNFVVWLIASFFGRGAASNLGDVDIDFGSHFLGLQNFLADNPSFSSNKQDGYSGVIVPFHLYDDCLPALEPFYAALNIYLMCTQLNSIPPRICMACPDAYANLTVQYVKLASNNTEVRDSDCGHVALSNYVMSYASYLYEGGKNMWTDSRCESCIEFTGLMKTPAAVNYTYAISKDAMSYLSMMDQWRTCVRNVSHELHPNDTSIACTTCYDQYVALYNFYWNHFAYTDEKFCIDITSTMNDTVYLWRHLLKCDQPILASRQDQTLAVALLGVIFCTVTIIFYIGSYVQGERKLRRLLKYSKLSAEERDILRQDQSVGGLTDTAALRGRRPANS